MKTAWRIVLALVPLIAGVERAEAAPIQGGGGCEPAWQTTFSGQPGATARIRAFATFDDGSGAALYAGGDFVTAGGAVAHGIARWDGTQWSALGSSASTSQVRALTVFDDGSGPALIAAGSFAGIGGVTASNIARWDGSSWSPLGSGLDSGTENLAVFDDGSGPALYAGGFFTTAGGVSAPRIAKWNGVAWSSLGSGMNGAVLALAVFDDGTGPALYAGGDFTTAGGIAAPHVARWNGATFSALALGRNATVRALATFDPPGAAPAQLYAAGDFVQNLLEQGKWLAKWNGTTWAAAGQPDGFIYTLAPIDDSGGAALYAGGNFSTIGGTSARNIARYDGTSWTALADGLRQPPGFNPPPDVVRAIVGFDDGRGNSIFAGGEFTVAGNDLVANIARWDGSAWSALAPGLSGAVRAFTVFDDGAGGGPALYAGGDFRVNGSGGASNVARWDGASWSPLGGGTDDAVNAFAVFDDGSAPALYAGGAPLSLLVRWDGSSWSDVGGLSGFEVHALRVYDDGTGPALYVGGQLQTAGGVPVNNVARWDGTSWSALGPGLTHFDEATVYALRAYNDGTGPALYAGGKFDHAGAVQARGIAKWDGATWSALGLGVQNSAGNAGTVHCLGLFGSGQGLELYVGGDFVRVNGAPGGYGLARWDGASWSSAGSSAANRSVRAFAVFDDGDGPALFAGGFFTGIGGPALNVSRWDGTTWSPLGPGVNNGVETLQVLDVPGAPPSLFVGGDFTVAYESGDSFAARYESCVDAEPPTLSCPTSVVQPDPLTSPPGEVVFFTVVATDDVDPAPSVVCVPPSGSFFPAGTTIVTCTATDSGGSQSTCTFPVLVARKYRRN